MRYFAFKNAKEFQELFGRYKTNSGADARRNKIALSFIKDPWIFRTAIERNCRGMLKIRNMQDLKKVCMDNISACPYNRDHEALIYTSHMEDGPFKDFIFRSDVYEIDRGGLCVDGSAGHIRYINHANNAGIYKMKAGKFFGKIIAENWFGSHLPEPVARWLCEEFAHDWTAWASEQLDSAEYTLCTGSDYESFRKIYSSRAQLGGFHSCMNDKDVSSFYVDSVDATAAWMEDADGRIAARCVIYNHCEDEDGNVWRLAERQYAKDIDDNLKRQLVVKLIRAGLIDGYKQVGASYDDPTAFVKNDGTSLGRKLFRIECTLDDGGKYSYQDSFKCYDYPQHACINRHPEDDCYDLGDCEEIFHVAKGSDRPGYRWSDWHECWIPEDDAVWVDGHSDWFHFDETVYSECRGESCLKYDATLLYNDDWCLDGYAVELHDGDYAYVDDPDLVELWDGEHALRGRDDLVKLYNGDYCLRVEAVALTDGDHAGEWAAEDDNDTNEFEDSFGDTHYVVDDDVSYGRMAVFTVRDGLDGEVVHAYDGNFYIVGDTELEIDWDAMKVNPRDSMWYSRLLNKWFIDEDSMLKAEDKRMHALVCVA